MARIVKLWGPSKTAYKTHEAVWTFSALHEDGRSAMYRLTFRYGTRRFKTAHLGENKQVKAYQQAMLTFTDAKNGFLEGKVTDILKSQLSPEHLAELTALAINYGRR